MTKRIVFLVLSLVLAAAASHAQEQSEQMFQGFNLQGYDDEGEKSWDVKGDTADVMGSDIKLNNVDANSYNKEGKSQVNVTAETGFINQASGNMRLEKDVIVTGEGGTQLLTDTLDWSRNDDLVETEDDVIITDDGLTVTGRGMEAHPNLRNAEVKKDVRVSVDPRKQGSDAETVTITSDGPMVIDQATGMATFEDNVVAVQTTRTLKADKMEIYFAEDMKGVKEMVCIGNVEIVQGENQSFADKAVYNAAEQRLVLSGQPKLIMVTEGKGAITTLRN